MLEKETCTNPVHATSKGENWMYLSDSELLKCLKGGLSTQLCVCNLNQDVKVPHHSKAIIGRYKH